MKRMRDRKRQPMKMYVFKRPTRDMWSVVCGTCALINFWPNDVVLQFGSSHEAAMKIANEHIKTCWTERALLLAHVQHHPWLPAKDRLT